MTTPDSFFTPASCVTLVAATMMVVTLVNTIRHFTHGWGPRWFAFLVSIAVAIVGYLVTKSAAEVTPAGQALHPLINYMIVAVNGCLIYTSAFGLQNAVVASIKDGNGDGGSDGGEGDGGDNGGDDRTDITLESASIKASNFRTPW